jgi:signal peptidase II
MKPFSRFSTALATAFAGKGTYLLASLAVVVLDQWSKWWVEAHLAGHAPVRLLPGLVSLTHVRNTGVAFGLFPAEGSLLGMLLLSLLGLAGFSLLAYYFLHTPLQQRLLLASLALVLGGAVGNLIDRVASGAVTDFVDVYFHSYHWYTFNVADSAITIGIVMMTAELFLPTRRAAVPAAAESSHLGASPVAEEP